MPQWDEQGRLIEEADPKAGAKTPLRVRRAWDENGREIAVTEARAEPARQQRRAPPSEGEDFGRAFVSAIPRGFAALAALPREINDLSANWAEENQVLGDNVGLRRFLFGTPSTEDTPSIPWASTREIDERIITPLLGEQYQPQTTAGEYGRTIGEFVPNAVFPGSMAARAARVVVPGAASEAAGQATEGTPYEAPARFAAAIGGGIATEMGLASGAARQARNAPRAANEALEQEFAPMTRGERSGNTRQRLDEEGWRRGQGSDQAQSVMRGFDADRARQVRDRGMRIVSRGQEPISQSMDEAGVILGDELRTARQNLWDRARRQYDEAFSAARNERVPPSDELAARIDEVARENLFDVPPDASRTLAALNNDIRTGQATQANVERARQELSRRRTQAVNARQDADEFVYSSLIQTLDDWSAGLVRDPAARAAMNEARGIYREMRSLFGQQGRAQLSTGHIGRADPGGRAIDRAINTELTGEQIIDGIVGGGARPSQQALGAVRRIKQLGTETVSTRGRRSGGGIRAPGRTRRGGQTAGQRRFAADDPAAPGGAELPTQQLQALREGLMHRMFRPIDDYISRIETTGEGGVLPAQRMVTQLDNALNKSGRQIMETLYTPRELEAMRRLLRYFQTIVPPAGVNYSGTTAGLYRLISGALSKAVSIIPGLGPVLTEAASQAASTGAARAAVRAPRAATPRTMPIRTNPDDRVPIASGALALPEDERSRRLGEGL